ncbi:transient receptor potential channel-like isoform X2 [Rhopilema esculentum]
MIFWSIFSNMPKLVDCFWEHESDKAVENAVIIFRVAKSLSNYTVLSETARKSFKSLSEEYEKRAVDVLTCYYQSDTEAAIDIVKRQIPLWGNKSILTIAANSGSREIVSHSSCQEYLTDVWNGKTKEDSQIRDNEEEEKKEDNKRKGIVQNDEIEKQTCLKLFRFLFLVPKGKLFLYELMFTIFLGCFSFIVLVKKGKYHDPLRFTVFTIVTALAIDEIREVLEIKKDTMCLKLKEWMKSIWNRLDVIALILSYVGFAFGFYHHRTAERSMMAVDLVLWVIKFAQFYRMFYSLGPYLIMIYKMIFHMAGFFLVLVIAVIAYGIFMHTLLFPDVTVSWKILFQVLFRPYLLAFGELGVEKHDLTKGETIYGTPKVSESTELIVVIGMCLYLLLANVLLINMLIAVFNNIYEDIKENSDKIWRFDKTT